MKTQFIILSIFCLLLTAACKDGNNITNTPPPEPDPVPNPVITAISPDSGKADTEVTITGSNFGLTPEANTVTFNGAEAVVTSAGESQLVVKAPEGAEGGPVAVTVAGKTANGPEFFFFPDNARFVNGDKGSDANNDCYDYDKPCASIGLAIEQADPEAPIYITPGIYTEMLQINKSVSLIGSGQDPLTGTVIQAHADPGMAAGRVIYIREGNVVSIENLTIRHGRALLGGGQSGRGGGISVVKSELKLLNVTLEKNTATYGGGIHNSFSKGHYINVTFRENRAVRGSADNFGTGGGGIYNFSSTQILEGVAFFRNIADAYGGGMLNLKNTHLQFLDVTFTRNTATYGGGMYCELQTDGELVNVTFTRNKAHILGGGLFSNLGCKLLLTHVTFTENQADAGGGGMYNHESSPVLTDVTFSRNIASGSASRRNGGGGLYSTGTGASPILKDVVFKENKARVGGGGMRISRGSATLQNVIFLANTADQWGGGMFVAHSSPKLTNVKFYGNSSDRGGGMYNWKGATPLLINAIFAGNSANSGGGGLRNTETSSVKLVNSIIWGNTAGEFGGEIVNNLNASTVLIYCIVRNRGDVDILDDPEVKLLNSLDDDPLFLAPGTGDLRLKTGSPAINAGDPGTKLSIFPIMDGIPVDLDDKPRVVGGRIDIGAYENQDN